MTEQSSVIADLYKQVNQEREFITRILAIASRHTLKAELFKELSGEIQAFSGCQAVGIRILDEDGKIPYEGYVGFPRTFYEIESPLLVGTDLCMCINIILGNADPSLPFISNAGSFYSNGTTHLLATVSQEDKGATRNTCNAYGYESVALVPIRLADRILGLIHLADRREGKVPLPLVETMERIADQLGASVSRVMTEEKIHQIERRFRAAFDSTQDCIIVWDKDYNYLYANQTAIDHVGATAAKVIGKNIRDGLGHVPGFMRLWMKRIDHVFKTEQALRVQDECVMQDRWYYTDSILTPIRNGDDKVTAVCVVYRDITELKRAEKQIARSLEEKETMLREIHHRVKNNMQIISSLLNLQLRYIDEPKSAGILQEVKNRIKVMALIHDKLYKTENLTRVNMKEYIDGMYNEMRQTYMADGNNIKFQNSIGDIPLEPNYAVPCGLIINELVCNSFKHAFPAGANGKIEILFGDGGDSQYELIVRDNGIGFPSNVDFFNSSSMGLNLVRILAEGQLRGKIELNTDGGTEFRITFY